MLVVYRGYQLLLTIALPLKEHLNRHPACLTRAAKKPSRRAPIISPESLHKQPFPNQGGDKFSLQLYDIFSLQQQLQFFDS
jgi:hypothetical protein